MAGSSGCEGGRGGAAGRGSYSPQVAEGFARADPYVTNGLVVRWRVREWTTVAGGGAATPIQP